MDIVDQMKDLMLGEEGSPEEKDKLTKDSPIFHTAAMSTKVMGKWLIIDNQNLSITGNSQ